MYIILFRYNVDLNELWSLALNQLGRLGDAAPVTGIVVLLGCQCVHIDHLGIVILDTVLGR